MPAPDQRNSIDVLDRDRREADRRYNDALTALDRAIVDFAADDNPPRHDLQRLGSLLLVFLQQITPYVDTKLREASAAAGARLDGQANALEALSAVQGEVALLHRAVQLLKRERAGPAVSLPAPTPSPAAAGFHPATDPGDDAVTYLGFEDRFRGSDEEIRERLRAYLPLFAGASNVVDLGCGRGEFLALLRERGVAARGVDSNRAMVAVASERGLDAIESDALTYLRSVPDGSLGGAIAAQVVEHLQPSYLTQLLRAAYDTLAPGAPLVIETINPACWLAFFSSYLRDFTHVRPIHPETLQYLMQASGFSRVSVRYSAPVPDAVKMKPIELAAEVLGSPDPVARALVDTTRVLNANGAILNNLLFTHLDYAAIGYRS